MRHASHAERTRLCNEAANLIALLHENNSKENRLALSDFLRRSPEHVRAFFSARSAILEFAKLEYVACLATRRRKWSLALCCGQLITLKFRWIRVSSAFVVVAIAATVGYMLSLASVFTEPIRVFDKSGTYTVGHSSNMTLHQGSEAELRSFDEGRGEEVTLVKGGATFFGEHTQTNPFRVAAYPVIIEMTGTRFNVLRPTQFSVEIDVTSGDVVLRSKCPKYRSFLRSLFRRERSPLPRDGLHLEKGNVARVSGDPCDPHVEIRDTPAVPEKADSAEVLLQFSDTLVREAVRMFNSHSATPTIVVDDVIGRQRVRGEFLSSRVESFVAALQKEYGATAVHQKGANGKDVIYLHSSATVTSRQ
jgi:ferric-dicitrate binding protein FerR (iron transport regulator)